MTAEAFSGSLTMLKVSMDAAVRCSLLSTKALYPIDILTLSKTLGNELSLSAGVTSYHITKVSEDSVFLSTTTHVNGTARRG